MTDDRSQETQQELFQQFSPAPKRPERFPVLAKTQKPILISTTLEQILMVSIVGILLFCGVFFLGVLRGKSLKPAPAAAPAVNRQEVPKPTVMAPQRPAVPAVSAPAPAPPVAAQVSVNAGNRPYTVQLVTYRKREYAEAELAVLRKMGFTGYVIQKGEYFQVYAGQYASKEEAKRDLKTFQAKYKDSFLTRRA